MGCAAAARAALAAWCAAHGHPLRLLSYQGPQAPAHAVARLMRRWYTNRGEAGDRLIVPSFILGDPWATLRAAAVPYWTFFAVKPALDAFHTHLRDSAPYRAVDILLFQHGVRSLGIAEPDQRLAVARRYTPKARLLALDPRRSPHDIASLGRYAGAFKALPAARPLLVATVAGPRRGSPAATIGPELNRADASRGFSPCPRAALTPGTGSRGSTLARSGNGAGPDAACAASPRSGHRDASQVDPTTRARGHAPRGRGSSCNRLTWLRPTRPRARPRNG